MCSVCMCIHECMLYAVYTFVLIVLHVTMPTTVFCYVTVTSAGLEIHPAGRTMAGRRGFHPPGVCAVCMCVFNVLKCFLLPEKVGH